MRSHSRSVAAGRWPGWVSHHHQRLALEAVRANFAQILNLASTAEVVDDTARYRVKPGADHP